MMHRHYLLQTSIFFLVCYLFCFAYSEVNDKAVPLKSLSYIDKLYPKEGGEDYVGSNSYLFPIDELNALRALYDSTHGPFWIWNVPYDKRGYPWFVDSYSPDNPCNSTYFWQGISCSSNCSASPCNVVAIVRSGNILRGRIPNLLNLTLLEHLDLSANRLNYSIPESLANLKNLRNLSLAGNLLRGPIPSVLGNLKELQELNLRSNYLNGTIPPTLGNLNKLVYMNLELNNLTGTIPNEFGNLTSLTELHLSSDHLIGTIPAALGDLVALKFIDLGVNKLTGSIPPEFGNLVNLRYLQLTTNNLTGTIPRELGRLHGLISFELLYNQLTGTIPPQLGNLTTLQVMNLYSNNLTGELPVELGNLIELTVLGLGANNFTGSIPVQLGNLSNLNDLDLSSNKLTGSIPAELGFLNQLVYFDLFSNDLTGTIPASLGNLSLLEFLELYANILVGTIPPELSNNVNLLQLDLSSNLLTGSIPAQLGRSEHHCILSSLILNSNQLSGSIPLELGNCGFLRNLILNSNNFIGTMPTEFGDLRSLREMIVNTNKLTGIIPSALTNLNRLRLLDLDTNFLSGSVPALGSMRALQYLELHYNHLSGEIPLELNTLRHLEFLFLFGNQLTGTISEDLFHGSKAQHLKTFAVGSNCLTGSIPTAICGNGSSALIEILLDGMGTADQCQDRIFAGTSNKAYLLNAYNAGTIPACLLQLPNIQTLHLSGLMLDGSIPSVPTLPATLQYMSLSYNTLTGMVPNAIWQHNNWLELDLSFNRLNGYINNLTMNNSGTLNLQLNRLSGTIPSNLLNIKSINLLEGNIFTCNYDSSKLPANDGDINSYQCGSDYVNTVIYGWIAIVLVVVCLSFPMLKTACGGGIIWTAPAGGVALLQLTKLLVYLVAAAVFVLIPLCASMKAAGFGTYSSQYAWILSSCYLSGIAPALLLFVAYNAILGLVYWKWFTASVRSEFLRKMGESESNGYHNWKESLYVVGAVVVVGAVNGSYVYGLQQNVSRIEQGLMAVALSLFKAVTLYLVKGLKEYLSVYELLAFLCYCNVVAPYFAELFVSTDCFYYAVLQNEPSVTSNVEIQHCTLFRPNETLCQSTLTPFTYDPPFVYSYTCSSSLVTSFAVVFLLRYAWMWILLPLQFWLTSGNMAQILNCIPTTLRYLMLLNDSIIDVDNLATTLFLDLAVLLTFGMLFMPLGVVIFASAVLRIILFKIRFEELKSKSNEDNKIKEQLDIIALRLPQLRALVTNVLPYLGILAAWFWAFTLFDTLGDVVGATKASGIVVAMCVSPFIWYGAFAYWKNGKGGVRASIKHAQNLSRPHSEAAVELQDNPLHFSNEKLNRLEPLQLEEEKPI